MRPSDEGETQIINFWGSVAMADALTRAAQSRGWSRAELLRRLARKHLDELKHGKEHANG